MENFKEDVAKNRLPLVSFIEPRYYDRPGSKAFANDMHPPHHVGLADELVASVYETLASNPALFAKTLFIVTCDEHGGSYDHVVPPTLENPRVRARVRMLGLALTRVPPPPDAGAVSLGLPCAHHLHLALSSQARCAAA